MKLGRTACLAVAALALGGLTAPEGARAQRSTVVYWVQHRVADELLPLAQAVLAGEGAASVDRGTNSIVLVGPRGPVEEAVRLLRQQDQRLRSIVLRYESKRLDELDARGIRIDWATSRGDVRVGNVRFPGDSDGIRVGGFAVHSERAGGLTGMLRVLEGQSGRITTGELVPVRTRSRWWSETTWVQAESGFEARPRVLGDGRIRVELAPIEAEVDLRGNVAFTQAATTVTVAPGETVAVGGVSRSTDARQRGSRVLDASQRARTERVLLLTADVEGDAHEATSPR